MKKLTSNSAVNSSNCQCVHLDEAVFVFAHGPAAQTACNPPEDMERLEVSRDLLTPTQTVSSIRSYTIITERRRNELAY
ncbi:hypothetical protein KUCAC02_007684 [Chaenocephalus aceratus]|uniref:Uncharacterized protein n=1 Tax=Chaenocephalus aceratus TaxID=36190 RepID=A0ACB9X755_CHAAC|nr:hypothetical protein KUCAC02_007684 [Chaenocephalus aceratus]